MEQIKLEDENHFISDHDLAVLADWAATKRHLCGPDEQKGFTLLREGADFILRRRARSRGAVPAQEQHNKENKR